MNNRVLVLGAGLVARPLIRYLLEKAGCLVTVATRTRDKAVNLIEGHPGGTAVAIDVTSEEHLRPHIAQADVVISLVPYAHHVTVAKLCIELRKHMVTTSYVSDAMRSLDGEAKKAGILIMNEIGLDPGIDHMSAMKIIHAVQGRGGSVISFTSFCGGLPAPEANDNPFGYKFSWSPRGVVLAARNLAKFLEDGKVVEIPGEDLFNNYRIVDVEGVGSFEGYPNRDSLGYIETYGIPTVSTMLRGTLRNHGWCATWKRIADTGWLDDCARYDFAGMSLGDITRRLIKAEGTGGLRKELARYLEIPEGSEILDRFDWLGLTKDEPVPLKEGSALDALVEQLMKKLWFREGERDMIVLHHDFEVETEEGRQRITSTLVDYGIPGGDSAMARTVALPAAICTRLVLEGKLPLTGVHAPVLPVVYEPVLRELEDLGIKCREVVRGTVS